MITLFRKFFQSKVGIVVTLAFLGLIAFAFGTMDVANTTTFGGVAGGDRVATVGEQRISTSDYREAITSQIEQIRQQNPTITPQQFFDQDGDEQVLEQMLQVWAISEYAQQMGLRSSKRLVDSEIARLPGFTGLDGNFDMAAFRERLRQLGRSEENVRREFGMNLMTRQLVVPATQGAKLPTSIALSYAQLNDESRTGLIAAFPAVLYAPEGDPDDAALEAFYAENRETFTRPERRTIRYATFGPDAIGDIAPPSDEQIASRYESDAELYAATQLRSFTQLILPTQAAAQAVIDEVAGGVSLEASALSKGLTTVQVPQSDRASLSGEASAAVAEAGFAAPSGGLSEPAQGDLGWYVLRVDGIEDVAARSLDQVRGDIAEQLQAEARENALDELTSRIEFELSDGRGIVEVAEEVGATVETTPDITAQGQIYGTLEPAPGELARVLSVAFDMDEAEPQLAEIVAGQQFLIFDVGEITESSIAPLDEIREDVTLLWRRDEGLKAAGEATTRVLARMDEGSTLLEAMRAEEVNLPPPAGVTLQRSQLEQQRQRGEIPPPLALMFAMAKNTVKPLEFAENDRWFIIELQDISAQQFATDDPQLPAIFADLDSQVGSEYALQLVAGIEKAVATEVNQVAVDAVIDELSGRSN